MKNSYAKTSVKLSSFLLASTLQTPDQNQSHLRSFMKIENMRLWIREGCSSHTLM